jgi:hypothetical protein
VKTSKPKKAHQDFVGELLKPLKDTFGKVCMQETVQFFNKTNADPLRRAEFIQLIRRGFLGLMGTPEVMWEQLLEAEDALMADPASYVKKCGTKIALDLSKQEVEHSMEITQRNIDTLRGIIFLRGVLLKALKEFGTDLGVEL